MAITPDPLERARLALAVAQRRTIRSASEPSATMSLVVTPPHLDRAGGQQGPRPLRRGLRRRGERVARASAIPPRSRPRAIQNHQIAYASRNAAGGSRRIADASAARRLSCSGSSRSGGHSSRHARIGVAIGGLGQLEVPGAVQRPRSAPRSPASRQPLAGVLAHRLEQPVAMARGARLHLDQRLVHQLHRAGRASPRRSARRPRRRPPPPPRRSCPRTRPGGGRAPARPRSAGRGSRRGWRAASAAG